MHSSAVSIVVIFSLHLLFVTLALRVWIPSDPAFSLPWLSLSMEKTREALVILLSIRLLRRKEVIQYKCMMYWMLWEIIWFSSHIFCSFFHPVVVALDSCFMLLHLILLMISPVLFIHIHSLTSSCLLMPGSFDFFFSSLFFFFLLRKTGSFSRFIDLGCFFLSLCLPWLLVSLSCPASCWFLVHSFPSPFMTNDKIYKRRKRKRVTSTTTRNKLHTWMVFC